jgi:hypothetical protein
MNGVSSEMVKDTAGHPLWLEDPFTRQMLAFTAFVNQLPIDGVERFMNSHPRLRLIGLASSAAVVGYESARGNAGTSPLARASIQTTRLSSGRLARPFGS